MCSVMIAIEYSYKLDTKNDFNLWCELGRFLHRQSQMQIKNFEGETNILGYSMVDFVVKNVTKTCI